MRTTTPWSGRWWPDGSRRLAAGVGDQIHRGEIWRRSRARRSGRRAPIWSPPRRATAAADANLHRESELADKKISSERERELAHAQWVTEQAGVRAATMRLRAIGLSAADIEDVDRGDLAGRVPIRAPIGGTVIERKVTLGQAVERATDAFKIADTSRVWVTLDLYEKDLFRVHVGQEVEMLDGVAAGRVLPRAGRLHRPRDRPGHPHRQGPPGVRQPEGASSQAGQLVTARIVADDRRETAQVLAVPRSAVEQVEGKTVVFVQTGEGFERRNVLTGASGGDADRDPAGARVR